MRLPSTIAIVVASSLGFAQTPPQKPNTTPVPKNIPLTLPGPPRSSGEASQPITANDAARIALRLQPTVTIAQAQADQADAAIRAALSALLPSINFSSDYSYSSRLGKFGVSGTSGQVTSGGGFTSSVTVSQLVFDFNRSVDSLRQAKAGARAAQYNLSAVQANLVFSVKQQFYLAQQDLQLVAVNQANVNSNQDQYDLAVARLTSGLGAPADVVTADANLANATSGLVQAQQTALEARIQLAMLMGLDPRTPLTLATSSEPEVAETDLTRLVDQGLRKRPEILQAEQDLQVSTLGVSIARKGNLPTLALSLGAASRGPTNPFATDTGSVGLSLNWDLYNGGLTGALTDEARAQVLSARANLVSATQAVVADVSTALLATQSAQQRLNVANSAVANATEGLRLAQGRYRAGVTTFVEVTQAQATLLSAESDQVAAKSALETAKAQLSRAIGTSLSPSKPDALTPIAPSDEKR